MDNNQEQQPQSKPWTQNFAEMFGFSTEAKPPSPAPHLGNKFQEYWNMYVPRRFVSPTETQKPPSQNTSQEGGLDAVFQRLVQAESGGRHKDEAGNFITSKVGARGITQIMPKTGKNPGYGVAPLKDDSEAEYLRMGRELLTAYINKYGDVEKGVAAYNYGPRNVDRTVRKHGGKWKDHLPDETKNYLKKVVGNAR